MLLTLIYLMAQQLLVGSMEMPNLHQISNSSTQILPAQFDLMSWNIYKMKRPKFQATLQSFEQVHIKLLQEAKWPFIDFPHHNVSMFKTFQLPLTETYTGVAIASRYQPLTVEGHLSPFKESFLNTPKSLLCESYQWQEQQLKICNIHALNFVSVKTFQHHIDQLAALEHTGPLIWGGDFNTWSKAKL